MPNRIGILCPNVKDINEYYQVETQLTKEATEALENINGESSDGNLILLVAKGIYDRFSTFASENNRDLYMTWDEVRKESRNIPTIEVDNAIKYLLEKGFLKEGFIYV